MMNPPFQINDQTFDSNYNRISWDRLFIDMCFLVAKRSPDAQTQCGAVIVDDKHRIISVGFNGWIRGSKDNEMPNLRPLKYQNVIHSEVNAILNARSDLEGCKIYITGPPCPECLKIIIQSGIKEIIIGTNVHSTHEKEKPFCDWMIKTYDILYRRANV